MEVKTLGTKKKKKTKNNNNNKNNNIIIFTNLPNTRAAPE